MRSCDGWCYLKKKRELPPHLLALRLSMHERSTAWVDLPYPVPPMPISAESCTRAHAPREALDFYYAMRQIELGPPSDRHALVVTTAPRPVPTLSATLDSLARAGSGRWVGPKLIASDGPLRDDLKRAVDRDGWIISETPSLLGDARAFIHRLQLTLTAYPDLDRLTMIEDDVEMCQNALDYVGAVEVPADLSLITWFTYDYDWSKPARPPQGPQLTKTTLDRLRGLLGCRPSRFFILTQAVTMPRETVERLLCCPYLHEWPKPDGHDEMIAWALGDSPYAAHFPVLVQHTAGCANSAVTQARASFKIASDPAQEGARSSPLYVGPDFDAKRLLNR